MSRIGKKTIQILDKVEVKINGDLVVVKGPKGELQTKMVPEIKVEIKDPASTDASQGGKEINIAVPNENIKQQRSNWGTYRQLIENMIIGVSEGFSKKLELNGVGFRVEVKGKELILNVGFSHPVIFKIPDGIEVSVEKNIITVTGIDKQKVGETAAQIRKIKKPEPYKGKGIKYIDEVIRRKSGKQAKGATT